MNMADWEKWEDIHEDPEQKKRIDKSYKAECTPLSVDTRGVNRLISGKFRRISNDFNILHLCRLQPQKKTL